MKLLEKREKIRIDHRYKARAYLLVLKLLDECGLRRKFTTIIQRKGLHTSPFFYVQVAEKEE